MICQATELDVKHRGLEMQRSHQDFSQPEHLFSLEVVAQINGKYSLPPEGENMFTRAKCFLMPVYPRTSLTPMRMV